MKTRITTLLLALVTSMSFGQMTFVKEVNGNDFHFNESQEKTNYIEKNAYLVKEVSEYKYELLNPDFSLYKSINIDTAGLSLTEESELHIVFSNHLFNSDDKVEILYSIHDYNSNRQPQMRRYRTVIMDEDGIELQLFLNESVGDDYFPVFGGKSHVWLVTENKTSKFYSIEGFVSCKVCNTSSTSNNTIQSPAPAYIFSIFPNPTDGQLNITSDLDETNMQIKMYSTSGQLLQTDAFFTGTTQVNVSSLAAGTYVINITSDKGFLHTEQFVKK